MMHRASVVLLALSLGLAGAAIAAPHKPRHPAAHKPAPACVAGEPSFWRDQALTTKLASELQFNKKLFREHVDVKVTGGAAILSGNLSSQELIDVAVRTAAGVGGITCVQNYLKVGPPLPREQQ